jgi:hypothetical protein
MSTPASTSVTFDCDSCGKPLSFPLTACGRVEVCPECAAYIDVPHPAPTAPTWEIGQRLNDDALPVQLDFDFAYSYPRPRWEDFGAALPESLSPHELHDAYCRAARLWLQALLTHLPPTCETAESENFHVLCPTTDVSAAQFAAFCERCRVTLLDLLQDLAWQTGTGKGVVLAFPTPEAYYEYVVYFVSDGEQGGSSGMCIRRDYVHLALVFSRWNWRRVVTHEMTHDLLSHLDVPQWIEEGLAQFFEDQVLEQRSFTPTHALQREHRAFWQEHSLDRFWSGAAFHGVDDEQRLAYSLAETLVRIQLRDQPARFRAFLGSANGADAGNAASREHLGRGLAQIAADFLGDGTWEPQNNYGTAAGADESPP